MRILLYGATGMIGQGVLQACLEDPSVSHVRVVGRRPTGRSHPRLEEVLHPDLLEVTAHPDAFEGIDACFFCLGISSLGLGEAEYRRPTVDIPLAVAQALLARSPQAAFVYVSGAGTGRGKAMWARVKREAEEAILALPFRSAAAFRPAYVHPVGGERSASALTRVLYACLHPFYPLLRRAFPRGVTTTAAMGRAMLAVARHGAPRPVMESRDIDTLAQATRA